MLATLPGSALILDWWHLCKRCRELESEAYRPEAKNLDRVEEWITYLRERAPYIRANNVLLQVVLRHRELQEQEREAYGPDWNSLGHVFPSTNGQPMWPRNVNVAFKRVLRTAGLPETTRFHDLRHSCATLLIQQGVYLRVVMGILGHSSITTTADTCAHVFPDIQRDAAAKLDALFPDRDEADDEGIEYCFFRIRKL